MDHVIPLCLGGANTRDNLQVLCRDCNSEKGDTVADYRKGPQSVALGCEA